MDYDTRNLLKEMGKRMMRMETRITKFLELQGFDTQVSRARWDGENSILNIPSKDISLRECIDTIPKGCAADVYVHSDGREDTFVCFIDPVPPKDQ